MPTEARIAREAIQNSVDATLAGRKTEVFVWDRALSDAEVTVFKAVLGLDSPNSPTGRLAKLGLKRGNSFERMATGGGGIRITIIEDRNTCGLGFDDKEKKDRFEELCLFLGQVSTFVDGSRGGSYGFGKTVYQASSDCRTFLVYSVFQPNPENTSERHALLFGCSTFDGHRVEGEEEYTGRAWFGIPEIAESGQQLCSPIEDEAAHDLAQRLGFLRRTSEELGTSIMILGSEIGINDFRAAVEDYWWPRLISDKLSVELWEGNDDVIPPPEPLMRHELKPYIRCYELLEDEIPCHDDERKWKLNASRGRQRGGLAAKALPPDPVDEEDPEEEDTLFKNTVALIRSGPQMVVQYFDPGGRQRGNYAGTFVSHPDSEYELHLSEPPSHDAWNSNSERLRRADPTFQPFVSGILNSVKTYTRRFQNELNPLMTPTDVPGTRKLEVILAGIMSGKGLGPPNPPRPKEDPLHMRIQESRTDTATESTVSSKIEIKLRDDAQMGTATTLLSIRPTVVLDDNKRRDPSERLKLASVLVDGDEVAVDDDSGIPLNISKGNAVKVEAETERFDRDLYVDLEVTVRVPEPHVDQISPDNGLRR